jgi:hypothetical protein
MLISGSVTGAVRIGPFAESALPVNYRDCGSIPIFPASSAESATTVAPVSTTMRTPIPLIVTLG